MDKLKMHTPDLAEENFKKLAAMFPNAVTETINADGEVVRAIDKDVLMQEISATVVDGNEERYQFTWPDKKKSVLLANAPINKTLRPCREESVDFDNTENLYIEGDNLEALKLLQETYLGKVKMIYIDPPYNTGNDFVYEDDFAESTDEYLEHSGQFDEDGNRLFQNTESNGRFHTDWLNMIYPRLRLAKDLLSEDGVVFISIDDNEVTNLTKICDDVFGESNFEADFIIKVRHEKRILRDDIRYQSCIEHIICYSKSKYAPNRLINERDKHDDYCWDIELLSLPDKTIDIGGYKVEIYSKDKWIATKKTNGEGQFKEYQIRGSLISQKGSASEFYELHLRELRSEDGAGTLYKVIGMGEKGDGLGYRFIRQPYDLSMKNGFYYQGIPLLENSNKGLPYPNFFDFVVESNNVGEEGGVEYKGGKKPVALIEKIIEIAGLKNYKNSLVMDFFAGSATLAHTVMKLNAQYNYNLKYILVQLPENIDDTYKKASPKNKAALKNMIDFLDKINRPHFLTEIGKERIRCVGKKIKEENPLTTSELDIGFRVLKVDSTNMEDVYYRPADLKQEQLRLFADNIKPDRTPEDLLFQVMLDLGILLSSEIEETEIDGKKVFIVGGKYETLDGEVKTHLIACFDADVTENTVTEIAKMHPAYAVFRDSGMADDAVMTNFEQIFESYSPKTQRKVL